MTPLKAIFDRDTGVVAFLSAATITARLAEINLAIQILGGICGLIIVIPKVIRVFRNQQNNKKD